MSDRWPRAMRAKTTARYLDISTREFARVSKLPGFPKPRPFKPGGDRRYDRLEVAAWWRACAKIVTRDAEDEDVGRRAAQDVLRRPA